MLLVSLYAKYGTVDFLRNETLHAKENPTYTITIELGYQQLTKLAPHLTTSKYDIKNAFILTRKYLLQGYILGVLTHTTAWDQQWGGDESLRFGFIIE